MQSYRDQTGRNVVLQSSPRRIVSTVPSQTELLFDLGLEDEVVGITAYCCHPSHWLKEKAVIGGTKDLNIKKIRQLKPDLIIANKEENVKEQIEDLAADFPVWLSDIKNLDACTEMIEVIGQMTGKSGRARRILSEINDKLQSFHTGLDSYSTAYFIWKEPYMIASSDSFIGAMLDVAGLKPLDLESEERYPQTDLGSLGKQDPAVVLLSSEPYNFNASDLHQVAAHFPNALLKIVDGELLSWYGSRLINGLSYLQKLRREVDLYYL